MPHSVSWVAMRTYATILCLLLTSVPVYAVDTLQVTTPDPGTEAWRWTEFDRTSGLGGEVRDITQDRDGSVWFATTQGAQRYDGHRWTTYTTKDGLPHNVITAVIQAEDGAMWFGTAAGIGRYDPSQPEERAWTVYTTADGLAYDFVPQGGLLQRRDGSIWASLWERIDAFAAPDGQGICRFDGRTWNTINQPEGLPLGRRLFEASDGAFWTLSGDGVFRLDGTAWTRYMPETASGVLRPLAILESPNGVFWVSFFRGGIGRLNPSSDEDGAWRMYTGLDGLPVLGSYPSLFRTKDGTIWATSEFGDLCRFEGDRWKVNGKEEIPHFLGNDTRGKTLRDGTIWFWDRRQEQVFRFDPGRTRWSVFTHLPGVPFGEGAEAAADYVFTIGDAVWIPAQDGVIRYDGNTWTRHRAADGLIDGLVSTVLKGKDGSLWVAGQHRGKSGAARFNGLSWTVYSEADGLVGENVYAGHAARNGDIWLGTKWGLWADASGVMRFDGKEWTAYSTDDGLAHDMVYVISQTSDGAIWIGTRNGLSRFDPSAGTGSSAWTTFTGGVELTGGKVRALCPTPNGDLWIGYGGRGQGVTRFDGTTWTHYRDGNGPDGSAVFEITRSNDGSLWFGTDTGISTYDGTSWNHYTRDQIPIAYLNFRTIAESDDGALWIRGLGEVLRLVPDRDPPETSIEVAVEQVSSVGNIVLTWSGHDVWNSTPATKLRYQYHLNDGPWSNWSAKSDHTFTSLSSGHHTFEVRTADQGGNVDPTPAVHAFIVEAPWWRNPVVAGPGLLLIIGIVLQSVRVVKAKRKLQDSVDARSSANNELFQVNVDLQREQVLERLRGQAQGMQSSEDIGQVVENVFSELKALHSGVLTAGVTISRADGTLEVWRTQADGSVAEPLLGDGPLGFGQDSGRRVEEGEPYAHLTFEGEACRAEIQRLRKLGNPYWVTVPEERWPERKDVYSVSIPEGNVLIAAEESIPDETLMMVKRFGEVFGYAHSRWEELKVKEAQNRRLAVEASVQRLRAEVQSMDEASDFERILSLLTDSLKTVELTFDGCGIDVLDEPVEHPSMEHFEKVGFRYTAYRIDPRGTVSANSFHIPAPFDLPPSMCPHPELGYGCGERFGDRFRCRWAIAQ